MAGPLGSRTWLWVALVACTLGASFTRADAPAPRAPATEAEPAPLAVGAAMADFGLRELDAASGELKGTIWLSDYVGAPNRKHPTTKLVLLNFFASWCKPCQAELATLTRLQSQYASQGLQVLSVNVRRQGESFASASKGTQQLLANAPLSFPMLFDRYTDRTQQLYMGRQAVLPCNVLIDEQGRVAGRYQGIAQDQLANLELQVRTQLGLQPVASP
jgi:thiol-disulfide isomerase/thioredoxin